MPTTPYQPKQSAPHAHYKYNLSPSSYAYLQETHAEHESSSKATSSNHNKLTSHNNNLNTHESYDAMSDS